MTYIECLGIHGSGKTTVARAFVSLLRDRGEIVLTEKSAEQAGGWRLFCRKAGKYRSVVVPALSFFQKRIGAHTRQHVQGDLMQQFMLAHPQLIQTVMNGVCKLETWRFSGQQMLENFFQTAAVYQLAQQYLQERETLIIEEGFCQQAYHVLASRTGDVSDDAIDAYIGLIPRPAYLLAVLTPPEACEERLRARQKYPRVLDSLPFEEKIAYLRRRAAFHERIMRSLKTCWNIPIIEVPNIQDKHSQEYLEQLLLSYGLFVSNTQTS